jgi:hypothetical protein
MFAGCASAAVWKFSANWDDIYDEMRAGRISASVSSSWPAEFQNKAL